MTRVRYKYVALLLTAFLFSLFATPCSIFAAALGEAPSESALDPSYIDRSVPWAFSSTVAAGSTKIVSTLATWQAADADGTVSQVILNGSVTLTANFTPTKALRIVKGGLVNTTTNSKILNLGNVAFEAGGYQVFSSTTGQVVFSASTVARVIWFGADPAGSTESSSAVQAALGSSARVVTGDGGLYRITSELTLGSNITFENIRLFDNTYRTVFHRMLSATTQSNVHLRDIEVLGNNSSYGVDADGFGDLGDGFSNGCGIFLSYVTNGTVRNIRCQYLVESMVLLWCVNVTVDHFISRHAEAPTQTALTLAASTNCHVVHATVYNASDGALFIYNGTKCSIKDSYVEATTPATFNLSGTGMESCNDCTIENVTVKGCWIGIAVTEAVNRGHIRGNKIEGCHVGIAVMPFGVGYSGEGIVITDNSIVDMTDRSLSYPISGIMIHNNDPAPSGFYVCQAVIISNNYVGRSNAGVCLYAKLLTGKEVSRLQITGNLLEGMTYVVFDWETQQTLQIYSTASDVMYLEKVLGANITGNTFITSGRVQAPPTCEIRLIDSKNINFVGNVIKFGWTNNGISTNSGCENVRVAETTIEDLYPGGYTPYYLPGTNVYLGPSNGWRDVYETVSNTTIDLNVYRLYGFKTVVYTAGAPGTLAITLPPGVSGMFDEYVIINAAAATSVVNVSPAGADTIRGGTPNVVAVGSVKHFKWTSAGLWEVY